MCVCVSLNESRLSRETIFQRFWRHTERKSISSVLPSSLRAGYLSSFVLSFLCSLSLRIAEQREVSQSRYEIARIAFVLVRARHSSERER